MTEYKEISTTAELAAYRKRLAQNQITRIAMDFEAEFNLHVYGEHLCLIQVFDGSDFILIDPLKIDKNELKAFLEMKSPVKLFFGADSDRMLVYKQFGIKIASLFDVQHLVDVLELQKRGLDSVLSSQLGVEVVKKKKFQQYNWLRRPLDEEAKAYALGDVESLFKLNDVLMEKIVEQGLVNEMAYRIAAGHLDLDRKTVPGIFKTPAYKKMNRERKEKYARLVDIREAFARELNVPPNTVLTKQDLVDITYETLAVRRVRFNRRIGDGQRRGIVEKILSELS
ncbi:MAG: ribonuclease D [Spirochaetales bacterium]|nr:ribonuclease D [Spirochaetales bacterium]